MFGIGNKNKNDEYYEDDYLYEDEFEYEEDGDDLLEETSMKMIKL